MHSSFSIHNNNKSMSLMQNYSNLYKWSIADDDAVQQSIKQLKGKLDDVTRKIMTILVLVLIFSSSDITMILP